MNYQIVTFERKKKGIDRTIFIVIKKFHHFNHKNPYNQATIFRLELLVNQIF